MAMYFIGDLQGCLEPLQRLLQQVDFSPSRDTLYPLGDLVNRGPDSLGVLRLLHGLGDAARPILGNHDLHLLAVAEGLRAPNASDTLAPLLAATDRAELLGWLRQQPLAREASGWLLVHAGVLPGWTRAQALALSAEVQAAVAGAGLRDFLSHMYGNQPDRWRDDLAGWDRLRVAVNALTRLRYCSADGALELRCSVAPEEAPEHLLPWFELPGRQTANDWVAFGHWSTLSLHLGGRRPQARHRTLGLDTGCLWGGRLTAARVAGPGEHELVSVDGLAQGLRAGRD